MPKRLEITLSDQQRAELLEARDHHAKAYVREKAAAILKIADDNTVRSWLRRYLHTGLADLLVQPGRGKKSAFSPSARRAERRR